MTGPAALPARQVVVRQRLVDLVDRAADGQTVAISAPAGWGKSELLASWEQCRRSTASTAWISLEVGDDAPQHFWRKLLAALDAADPEGQPALRALAVAPDGEIDARQVVDALVDRVAEESAPIVVVIDDVHHLAGGTAA